VQSLSQNDLALTEMLRITDEVIIVGIDDNLYTMKSLRTAKLFTRPQYVLQRFSARFHLTPFLAPIARIAPALLLIALGRREDAPQRASQAVLRNLLSAIICYDLQGRDKQTVPDLLRDHMHGPRFTINHGLSITRPDQEGDSPTQVASPKLPPNFGDERKAFVVSHQEADAWAEGFGLRPDQMIVTGVPRHDPIAIECYQAASAAQHRIPWQRVIFLISRPSNEVWLTLDLKVRQIRVIHQFCIQHDLGLVVRCHPSESASDVRSALPSEEEGDTWVVSDAHPLHIARHAEFAVTFHSGLPIEMLALGVPTIEFQSGTYPGKTIERDSGLVVPADSEEEFLTAASALLVDRTTVTAGLQAAKLRHYAESTGAIRTIVEELERSVE